MTAGYLLPEQFVRSSEALNGVWSESDSLRYTRWLATAHYENFHVVSFLLPKHLHQDFYNVYSFCRWADDLGDEIGEREESLRLLEWWRAELIRMEAGETQHPVFVALRTTVQRHGIPRQPFEDLIKAFVQDQHVNRYRDWPELYDYCRYSANPVGHLVLYLCGYRDRERQRLSDFTCTALQMANHWQDVSVDLLKDRLYLPLSVLSKHGCPVNDVIARRETPAFIASMREMVEHARDLFLQGLPLIQTVDRRLAIDLELFSRGGLCVLGKIEKNGYKVLHRRPSVGKMERIGILLSTLIKGAFRRSVS